MSHYARQEIDLGHFIQCPIEVTTKYSETIWEHFEKSTQAKVAREIIWFKQDHLRLKPAILEEKKKLKKNNNNATFVSVAWYKVLKGNKTKTAMVTYSKYRSS